MTTGAPPANQPPVYTPPPPNAPPIYGAPQPGSYTAAPVMPGVAAQYIPAKSPGVAVLLEFVLAGAGSFYLNRIAQGLWWLLGTLGAAIVEIVIATVVANNAAQSAALCELNGGTNCTDDSALVFLWIFFALINVAWAIARMIIIYNQARANTVQPIMAAPGYAVGAGITVAPAGSLPGSAASGPPVSATSIIWLGVGLLGIPLLTEALGYVIHWPSGISPILLIPAYLWGVMRLRNVSFGRGLAEIFGLNALLVALSFVIIALTDLQYIHFIVEFVLINALIECLVPPPIAAAFAWWAAPWPAVRARLGAAKNSQASGFGGIVYGVAAALLVALMFLSPLLYQLLFGWGLFDVVLNDLSFNIVESAIVYFLALIFMIVGAWLAAQILQRSLALATAPAVAQYTPPMGAPLAPSTPLAPTPLSSSSPNDPNR
jgi:hypothetical protein